MRTIGHVPVDGGPDIIYQGLVVRVGMPDANSDDAIGMLERAMKDLPDLVGDAELIPKEAGGAIDVLDFYDVDNDELVFVIRAPYRQKQARK